MLFAEKVQTHQKEELINVSALVRQAIKSQAKKEGLITVFVPHTTAGITINENADPDVQRDIIYGLKKLNLDHLDFRHMEGNSPAHIKASLMGSSITIILNQGEMVLGTWQGIYFCEFDGPRTRKLLIHVQ